MYGHIKTIAETVKKAIDSVDGCEGVIYQVGKGGTSEDCLPSVRISFDYSSLS